MSPDKSHGGLLLYWIGVVMTVACVCLVVTGGTEVMYRFEHWPFPLSWAFAGIAMAAFLFAELCLSANPLPKEPPREREERSLQTPEGQAVEQYS